MWTHTGDWSFADALTLYMVNLVSSLLPTEKLILNKKMFKKDPPANINHFARKSRTYTRRTLIRFLIVPFLSSVIGAKARLG